MREEDQRNYYLAASLLNQIGTKSKQNLLKVHLARKKVSFSQFINNNQHEIYHLFCSEKCCQCTISSTILTKTQKVLYSKEMELLFNKMSKMQCHKPASKKAFCCSPSRIILYVDDLDITLLQCLLTNFCLDLFWRICLSNENKNLETFLDDNKHILFHLWKRNVKCCKSEDLSGSINDRQWAIIFETTHCGGKNIDTCQFSVKKGIIEKNLDTGLARVIFENFCPLFMSIQKLAQSRNDLAHNTKGELSNMEYLTMWSNITECIIAIARYLGNELEVKAEIEVLKEKIPSSDVYKIFHTHMLNTHKMQEDIRDNVIKLNEMFIYEFQRTKADSERTHQELTNVMNQVKEGVVEVKQMLESKQIMEEHDRADLKQVKQMMSGAYSEETALDRFNCGKCKQMFEDYSSDKLIILILNHKQECPGKQVRSATPETSRDHLQETSIKIELEGLSENDEDKTIQILKATNGLEKQTISVESVEKGSIIIWGRISKAFCYAKTSVADVVEGFLGSFFISYPIETNDAVDITVKVGVVINEGNDLDDEGDCILCGKCKSEFITVSQYMSHQRTECKLRQLDETEQTEANINSSNHGMSTGCNKNVDQGFRLSTSDPQPENTDDLKAEAIYMSRSDNKNLPASTNNISSRTCNIGTERTDAIQARTSAEPCADNAASGINIESSTHRENTDQIEVKSVEMKLKEQSELRKAENEHTHKELNVLKEKMVNIEKQSELREAENEHTHKELKVLKEIMVNIISEVVFKGKVKSRSEFEAEDNVNSLEGAHSDDTAKSKDVFICGTCNQFYMETSDNMSIVIAEHKTKCPRRQAEKNFTTKITIDGLSRSYEDRTIKSSKVTDALEYQEISIDSVEKGGIVIWVRIPTKLCLSKKSVTSAVQGFLKSFFSNYPIETNDVANITVKLRIQLGEGNGLDDECDYIYCGKCQSEFKEVTQYYRHNNLECEVRRQNEAQNINKKDGSISVRNEQIIYQRLESKSGTVFETNSNVETSDISSSDKAPQPFVVNHLPGRISDIVHEMKKLCVQCSNIPTNTHDITSKTERNEEKNVKRRTVQELLRVSLGGIEPTLDSIVPTLMVRNSNGGDSYGVDDFILLHRYFCLGYDGGSSFESEPVLKRKMFLCIDRLLISGKGNDILRMIIDLSVNNGTWQHTPMNIALAVCAKNIIDPTTRARAYSLVPEVCRIPTHLFEFIEYCEAEGSGTGWGRSLRRAISNWYNSFENNPMRLVYLISRYKARHGWKHRDVVRLAHIKPANRQIELIIRYITHGLLYATSLAKNDTSLITIKIKDFLLAIETARKGINVHTNELKQLIIRHRLVKQHIHYSFLGDKQIWECLLLVMPTTALISNLDKMSSLNLFESQSVWEKNVIDRLQNISKEEQIHPITLLIAWYRYENNHNGYKGQFSWSINNKILNALEYAFYKAFDIIQPTQKRLCLAVDVSCSMKSLMFGSMLTAQDIAAAMVSLLTKIETDYEVVAFSNQCTRLHFTKDFGLSTSIKSFDHFPTGKSDCTMPIKWALDKSLIFDTFILFTDSETYNYNDQTGEVLNNYRISTKNKDVRLINVGMASNGFSISNPHDPSMIDITGLFRSAVKNIADFLQSDLPSYQYNYSSAKKNIEYCYSQLGIN